MKLNSVSMLVRLQEFVIHVHMNKTFIFIPAGFENAKNNIACLLSICDKLRGHY